MEIKDNFCLGILPLKTKSSCDWLGINKDVSPKTGRLLFYFKAATPILNQAGK